MVESSPALSHQISPAKQHEHLQRLKEKLPTSSAKKEADVLPEYPATEFTPRLKRAQEKVEEAKTKRIEKRPIPPLWEKTALFLPSTASFLTACGVDPAFVNPKPIGEGANHVVFDYRPDGIARKVVKIPRMF